MTCYDHNLALVLIQLWVYLHTFSSQFLRSLFVVQIFIVSICCIRFRRNGHYWHVIDISTLNDYLELSTICTYTVSASTILVTNCTCVWNATRQISKLPEYSVKVEYKYVLKNNYRPPSFCTGWALLKCGTSTYYLYSLSHMQLF
jgi:hypothetical protein